MLLRTLLSRSREECPSAEDEADLCSFGPSPLPDCGVVKSLQQQQKQGSPHKRFNTVEYKLKMNSTATFADFSGISVRYKNL